MSVLRTRTYVSAGATMALAAVGLVAPAMSASAATVVTPTAPSAGQSFQVKADSLTAGTNYRMVLASTSTSTTDVSESNSCSTATAATGGTLTCTITENTGGKYSLNVLSADGTSVVTSQAVTVSGVVSGVQTPVISDQYGPSDKVTVYAAPGVASYTVQDQTVTFAQGETSKIVDITPTSGVDWTNVPVIANAADGYTFSDGTKTQAWNFRTSNVNPTPAAVTVTAPTASDPVSTANDTITLTNTPGVTWKVNNKDVSFGSGDTVTVKLSDYGVTTYTDGKVSVPVVATATTGAFADGTTTKSYSLAFTDAKAEPTITRVQGDNRFDTSVEIAKKYFPGQHDTVYVANGMNFPDALAAGPAAAQDGAPLILAAKSDIQQNALTEIRSLAPKTIKVVGGSDVVSDAVAAKLAEIAPVTRIEGADRFATAAKVSNSRGTAKTVYLASGLNFPDALAGGSGAAREDAPMLLTNGTDLSDETAVELRRLQPTKVVIVGGGNVVKASVERQVGDLVPNVSIVRAAGTDRFDTSAKIIENVTGKSWTNDAKLPTTAFLATGLNYPDALAGIPAAYVAKAPLALTLPQCLPTTVKTELDKLPLTETVRLGSTRQVGDFSVLTGVCS